MDNIPYKKEYKTQIDNILLKIFIDNAFKTKNVNLISSLHTHSYTEIFVCKSKTMNIKAINQTITLHSGDIAIVPTQTMHLISPNLEQETNWISIGVVCSKCQCQSNQDLYSKISLLFNQDHILICKKENSLYEIIKKIQSANINEATSHILEFTSELIKLSSIIENEEISTTKTTNNKTKNINILLKLDYIINYEFMNPLTSEEIAKKLYISQRQLSRLVLNCFETNLHTLLTRKRISAATKLLIETSDTIENILLTVGFNNKNNFYREFKKIYGITPAKYRKSYKAVKTEKIPQT